jgi:hypothetical protein
LAEDEDIIQQVAANKGQDYSFIPGRDTGITIQ